MAGKKKEERRIKKKRVRVCVWRRKKEGKRERNKCRVWRIKKKEFEKRRRKCYYNIFTILSQ